MVSAGEVGRIYSGDMHQLPLFHYGAIYADPAWLFENWSEAGTGKNASQHYDCMTLDQIKALPVGHLATKDAALFLWVTDPLLPQGLEVMAAWGFKYVTVGFTWGKTTKHGAWHFGPGYWTRANPEMCLMGTTGDPKRLHADVRQLVIEPVREHSRKPDRIRDDIRRLVGGPYLELFARQAAPGWDAWGNQVGKFEAAPAAE